MHIGPSPCLAAIAKPTRKGHGLIDQHEPCHKEVTCRSQNLVAVSPSACQLLRQKLSVHLVCLRSRSTVVLPLGNSRLHRQAHRLAWPTLEHRKSWSLLARFRENPAGLGEMHVSTVKALGKDTHRQDCAPHTPATAACLSSVPPIHLRSESRQCLHELLQRSRTAEI